MEVSTLQPRPAEVQPANILIVDDDLDIRTLLAEYLEEHGYKPLQAVDGNEMWKLLDSEQVHLVVLDFNLPGANGLKLCRELRLQSDIPIIMLTARSAALDRILGLEMGADDYVCKPFEPRELLTRIRNILRRAHVPSPEQKATEVNRLQFAGWTLDLVARHMLNPQGVIVALSGAEYRLLKIFLDHPNQVLSRDQLFILTQGREAEAFDRTVDIQVSRLRQKLEQDSRDPQIIKTVRNEGYVLATKIKAES
ncbi:MAG TPA: response regulator [Methylophilaceae bacterium]|nr:response regulator [Methylophilaceae bacterium]